MFTKIFSIITVFLLTVQIISAQKIFQQPKTISQVVGKMNFENKDLIYRNSIPYVRNIFFNLCAFDVVPEWIPLTNSMSTYRRLELIRVNYLDQLSFFCKQEYRFEKSTKIPLRFRLGLLDYTNYLEQKPNALKSF